MQPLVGARRRPQPLGRARRQPLAGGFARAGYAPPPPRGHYSPAPLTVQAGGYHANGFHDPGATVTTVITATEAFEDTVTYTRPARKVWPKTVPHAAEVRLLVS